MSSDNASSPGQVPAGGASGRLTAEQVKLLAACVLAGRSRAETAKALSASPRSVTRWKKDPRVLAEVERAGSATIVTRALGVLEDLAFHAEEERTRLQAAQTIVRWARQL